ncbi:MAG TPA: diguanylate cyclase [Myxococcales bacterium]|nr:diguanylate cyclase [Myxococcales bacterium]
MPRYALIVEEDAGRAARYARMVASAGLGAAVVSTADEALSQVAKAGAPALVLLDHVVPQASGLDLLRGIRDMLEGAQPPAVIVADSRESYRLVSKEKASLNVAAVLRRWQPRSALERALRAALSAAAGPVGASAGTSAPPFADWEPAEPGGRTAEVLPRHLPAPELDPAVQADALDLAERLAEHPLVERLARLRVPRADTADDLQRLVADTAQVFEAPMALIWLERAGRVRFAAHPRPVGGRSLRSSGGDWTALRDAFGETPLHVEDAASHVFLAGNPLVTGGTIGCAAGAPLPGPGGRSIGTIALAASSRGAIPRSILDPLTFWAHRLVSELPAPGTLVPEAPRDGHRAAPGWSATGTASVLNEALSVGMMVSDARGTVTFANAALAALLGLERRKVVGMSRAAVVSSTGAPEDAIDSVSRAQGPEPRRFTVVLARTGTRRILRWQTRPVRVDGADGTLDEIVDVTREGEQIEEHDDRIRIDALTGLANRRGGEEALAREIAAALRGGEPLSVALFEVQVPAAEAAERAFRQVSWLLRDALRGYDLVVRFAARRLLAILPHARGPQAAALAERFRSALQRAAKQVAGATLTYGVAEFERAQDVERLLAQATTALDAANAKARRLAGREDA